MRVTCDADPQLQGTILVAPVGSLDTLGSEELLEAVTPRVVPETPSLLFDLSDVEWVSSAGVGAFIQLLARTRAHGGGLALFGCGSRVRTLLRVCGLESALNVRDTALEARDRLRELRAG